MIDRRAAVILPLGYFGIAKIPFAKDADSREPGDGRHDAEINQLRQSEDSFPHKEAVRRLLLVWEKSRKSENVQG
jgi:hypothetical protein